MPDEKEPIKLIVAGPRIFDHSYYRNYVYNTITMFIATYGNIEIVTGLAKGPDSFALDYAKKFLIPYKEFPADWDKHGKSAGYIRNSEMADYADRLLAFWDAKSKGTKHMLDIAKDKGLKRHVHILEYYPLHPYEELCKRMDEDIPWP